MLRLIITCLVISLHSSLPAWAVTAQELLDEAQRRHVQQPYFAGESIGRQVAVTLVWDTTQSLRHARHTFKPQRYSHVRVRTRGREEWSAISDTSVAPQSQHYHASESFFRQEVILLKDSARSSATRSREKTPEPKETSASAAMSTIHSLLRGYGRDDDDIVYRLLLPHAQNSGTISWDMATSTIYGEETGPDGATIYCVAGTQLDGNKWWLWINGTDFRVMRALQLGGSQFSPTAHEAGYSSLSSGFREFAYAYDVAQPQDADFFSINREAIDFTLSDHQTRFLTPEKVVEILRDHLEQQSIKQTNGPVRTLSRQILDPKQFESIILVDGGKSQASGFLTKLKGVDVVVTNLHALGSDQAPVLKRMDGSILAYEQVYAALDRDIAILRVRPLGGEGLPLAGEIQKSYKIGDGVVVVGNRGGGGVANEKSGTIKGIGPDRIEIDAEFETGHSGSPIVATATKEVVGVASYVSVSEKPDPSGLALLRSRFAPKESRWFGFRLDGAVQWQAIDLVKWREQGLRIRQLRERSDALVATLRQTPADLRDQPRIESLLSAFEKRVEALTAPTMVSMKPDGKQLMTALRALAEEDLHGLSASQFYNYYQTCLYPEENISAQLEFRASIVVALKKLEESPEDFLANWKRRR